MHKKQLTIAQALQKLKYYCGYQERCHLEVKQKLYELGVWKKDRDEITASLIEENYLNEERFAIAFAGGKWRMKKWGRSKIRHELKLKQVGEYNIRKALKQIPEEEYLRILSELASQKIATLKNDQHLAQKKKVTNYLLQKGFEPNLIKNIVELNTKG